MESELRYLNQNLEDLVLTRTNELLQTQDVTILCLAGLAETRDQETGQHLQRTRLYVKLLAEELQNHPGFKDFLSSETIQLLYKSAPLHDIGKVGIRDSILLKPGKLTPEEFDEMKQHTTYGGDALHRAKKHLGEHSFLKLAQEIAYHHHERWDGTGYPYGLKQDNIPISARLMALADVFDALSSKRVYKDSFSYGKTREIILEGKGSHFDPDVVAAFLRIEDKFQDISNRYRD